MAQTDKQDLSSSLARTTSVSSSNGDAGEYETYLVQDGDSLTKIAAMHDTTPTKLAQVNRMTSKFIFPGQVLKLPAPEPPKAPTPPPPEKLTPKIEKEMVDLINNFVRINVRHITDGKGIVDGTLLLTSKLVMFDPYAHHPLVVESSVENYEIIMPYHLVVNAVILKDYLSDSDKDPSLIYYQELKNTELIQELRHDERDDKCCEGKENKTENEQTALTTNTAAITTPPKESSSKTEGKETEILSYLRVRMGQPLGAKIGRDEMLNSYGQNVVLPDYWFILNGPLRVDYVYHFFNNAGDFKKYGVLDVDAIEHCGLELIREGRDAVEAEAGRTANRATIAKLGKQHLSMCSVDFNVMCPMIGDSELMDKDERMYLSRMLPQKLDCNTWVLVFSTSTHGFSLRNMMRKLQTLNGSLLLVLSDLTGNVFGAFLSGMPAISEHFEGTGETFLFTLKPELRTFNWTGENNFFYRCDNSCLVVGSSQGKFGLWLDRDLNKGRSQPCATFDSDHLTGVSEDFTLSTLECWAFEM